MLELNIGERVSFQPEGHGVLHGIIVKYNRKSVTITAETGQQWNVSPSHLRKSGPVPATSASDAKVIDMRKK